MVGWYFLLYLTLNTYICDSSFKIFEAFALNLGSETGVLKPRDDK
jgi:hypothetical protein